MKLKILALFFVLLFFSGCISQEKQFEYKSACLSLTSYSFQKIPKCSSQEDCFNKVEKQLFVFPNNFSFESADNLNSYKNNLASSWLYFNKSLSLVKQINQLCQNNNFSFLPEKTNELAFSLEKAFEFTDKANLNAFSFILIEKNFLDKQQIELIPEEELFDDFILLNQNLNELSTPEVNKTSDSFVSRYFTASRNFNEFSSKAGFYSLYLNEFTSNDLISFYQKDALNLIKSKKFYVPLLKKTFSSVLSFLFDFVDLERSVKLLNSMPTNELFNLFGDFASPENSVAFEFSGLVSDISEHKTALNQRNKEISAEIKFNINQISVELDELSLSSLNKFDSNVLSFLFEELENTFISEKQHEVYEIEDFVSESKEKLLLSKRQFNELIEKEYFNKISLGKKTNSLKKLNSEIVFLKEDIAFYSVELFDELNVLCDSKIKSIEDDLTKTNFSEKPAEINFIALRTAVKISSFEKALKKEKLFYCKDAILLNEKLSAALENQEKFFLKSEKSLNQCVDSLERIFYAKNLSPFVDAFYSLKSMKKIHYSYLYDSCSELKERILKYLYLNDKEITEVNLLFFKSKNLLSKISFLSKLYPAFFSPKETTAFNEKLTKISSHFSSDKLDFDFLEFSSEELTGLKKFNYKINSFFVSSLEKFLSAKRLSKTVSDKKELFFPNPLNEEINSEFSFIFPGNSEDIIFTDSCIKEIVKEGNQLRAVTSCIPKNGLFIEFNEKQQGIRLRQIQFPETKEDLSDLNELIFYEEIKDLNKSVNEKIQKKKKFLKEKQFFLNEKKTEIKDIFPELNTALSESEVYLPPITKKRLLQLNNSFNELKFFFDSDNNSFEYLISAEQDLADFEKNLNGIEEELVFSLNKMKEDAKVFLLAAKLSGKNISSAKKLFNKGKYVDSINESFVLQEINSTGFFSLPLIELPFQVYPLFGVIFFVLFRKFRKPKKKRKKPKRKISSN